MAYSEQDRTFIRHYLGFGAIFLQADPRLEAAITATQSQTEGGARPDSNTENYIKGLIYGTNAQTGPGVNLGPTTQNTAFVIPPTIGLLAIEQQIQALYSIAFIYKADQEDAVIDPGRGMAILRMEGRRLAKAMAKMLGMKRLRSNIFSAGNSDDLPDNTEPFWGNESSQW